LKTKYDDQFDATNPAFILWLLEPCRATSVDRWSGTMSFPNHANKVGQTVMGFTHFAHVYSKMTMAFADLQSTYWISFTICTGIDSLSLGTPGILRNGKVGAILFDPMCHTTEQSVAFIPVPMWYAHISISKGTLVFLIMVSKGSTSS
jgi:Alpha-kinase family